MKYPNSLTKYIDSLPYSPSEEQMAIVDTVLSTNDNLIIKALAGAAKTSTLKLIAYALPDTNIVSLAFNKAIAIEMKEELPGNCTCLTINSLGHRTWGSYLNKRLTLDKSKMYALLTETIEQGYSLKEREEISDEFSYILQCANHAKASGHLPDEFFNNLPEKIRKNAKRLMTDEALIESLDERINPLIEDILLTILNKSAKKSMQGLIDFGDQVLFPSLFKCMYPIHSLILVDEAQDLSPLNHEMLQQLFRRRIIAVGDQNQAIYAFRGAFESGMLEMQKRFDMQELGLTTTFRCPEEIVEHVRWRTPEMQSFEGTPSGSVNHLGIWNADDLPENCAILCRNNAPLFSAAVGLLRQGRYPQLWGNDIAKGLLKIMKSLGTENLDKQSALTQLAEWRDKKLKKVKRPGPVHDQYACIKIFLDENEDLGSAIRYAEYIFRCTGKVNLLTCHKSKGHEFAEVFILDESLMGNEGQDPNLRYVACTRSTQNLTYVESKNFLRPEED